MRFLKAVCRFIAFHLDRTITGIRRFLRGAELRSFVLFWLSIALVVYLIYNGTIPRLFDSEAAKQYAADQQYNINNKQVITDSRRTFERFYQWDSSMGFHLFVETDGNFRIVDSNRDNRILHAGTIECVGDAGNAEHAVGEFRVRYRLFNEQLVDQTFAWNCQWPDARLSGPRLFEQWTPHVPQPHPSERKWISF